jgi:uncharacterized damage-inducible protein DinB
MSNALVHKRPAPGDYADFYAHYVGLVEGTDIVSILMQAKADQQSFFESLPAAAWQRRYEAGKWSVAEVVMHIMDAERIFAGRALRIGRGDQTPLPGFDQDDYVPNSNAALRSADSILEEYLAIRESTIQLFRHFDSSMLDRRAVASGNEVSARALAFIIAGHEAHHIQVIRERYL